MLDTPFERPHDAVMQIAYAVPDLQAAIAWWIETLGVGPWFVMDRIGGPGTIYRGQPGKAEFTLAVAYSGMTMFELIQTLDDEPSMYKEVREREGYGFHHVALMRSNVRKIVEESEAKGRQTVFYSPTPGDGEVFFIEGGEHSPGMIELVEDAEVARSLFSAAWRAARDWKGERPIRNFMELLAQP